MGPAREARRGRIIAVGCAKMAPISLKENVARQHLESHRPVQIGVPWRDVRMVHQSERLALRLEPSDELLRVHAELDELHGYRALDRLFLLGQPDLPHAALAERSAKERPVHDRQLEQDQPQPASQQIARGLPRRAFASMEICRATGEQYKDRRTEVSHPARQKQRSRRCLKIFRDQPDITPEVP